ncbi:hypothetical protein A1Q2_08315 [Trichosporon asahii var. asahii CBS 8904]|uniref:SGNH hydrolase-type esterase domain-containing protein n=1 Tax=Trichosporon asahii var. asahii (strain CBS 8904) TaxID=1220162 RepID=K1VKV1_TRIAC|nr:hypothetical protein A1Q2_08315 [Trichosporon asahii var. asahii CBS 8904]
MDALAAEYDQAVLQLIREWNAKRNPTFAVVWQPGSAVDIANYPIEAVSDVDCFHPSSDAHGRLAAGFWNRYHLDLEAKAAPIAWDESIKVRCLEDSDRVKIPDL